MAIKTVSEKIFQITFGIINKIILINTNEIYAAIKDIFKNIRLIIKLIKIFSLTSFKKWVTTNLLNNINRFSIAVINNININFN